MLAYWQYLVEKEAKTKLFHYFFNENIRKSIFFIGFSILLKHSKI